MASIESQLERLQLNDPFENASQDEIDDIPKIKSINYLELTNFKSYAGYHYIGPFLPFTSVIGPNGGGKSNILDALCFLFCINPKNSRVYSMTELIYNREKVQSSKNISDQRDLSVAGSFTCEDIDSLKLRRDLNANGDSEFYVGNKKVKVEEYYKILYKNGVNTFAKNFLIMQGEAVALLEKTPKDLSLFFEYLSGSIVHKDKYDELKKISDDKENDLKEQQQKLAYFKSERRKLREKIENSKEYNKLSKKLDQTELLNQLVRLLEVDRQCYENVKMLKVYEEAIEGHKKKREDEGIKLQGSSITRRKIQNDIRKEQKSLETKKEEVSKLRADLTRDQTLEEMTGQTLQAKNFTKEKFEKDLAGVRENERNLVDGIKDLEKQVKELDEKIQKQKKDPSEKLKGRDYDEYRELNQKIKIQSHLLTQQLEKLYNDQKILVSRSEKSEEELQRKNTVISKLTSENKESTKLIDSKDKTLDNLGKELSKLKDRREEVSRRKEEKVKERTSLQSLRDTRNQLLLKQELLTLNQKDESKTKALFMDLIKNAKGFKGDLGSLVKPIQPRFEVALRLALGPAMKYLVVDKNETALVCSNILKDKSIMKDILVLENIPDVSTAELSAIRSQLGGLGNLASDIADFERSIVGLEKALLFLLDGKVVCENLGKVDAIKKRNIDGVRQLITLDGNVVKKGLIVGHGDLDRLTAGGRFADNLGGNLEDEIAKLQKEVAGIEEKVKGLRTDEEDLELHRISETMREIDGKINLEREARVKLDEKKKKDDQELTNEKRELAQITNERNKFRVEREELQKKIDNVKRDIDKLEEAVFGAFLKRLGLPSVKEFRGEQITEFERTVEEKEKLEKKLRSMKKERDELPIKKYEGMIEEVKNTIKEKETTLAEAKKRLAENKKKMETANKQYEQAKSVLDGLLAEDKKLADEISGLEKGFDQEKGDLLEQEKLRRERVNSVNQLLQRKKEIIEELQIKSIEVPFAGAEIDNSPQVIFEEYEDLFKKYFSAWNGRTAIDYTLLIGKEEKKKNKDKDDSEEGDMEIEESEEESREDPEERFRKWFENMTGNELEAKKKEYEATLASVTEKIDNYAGTSFPAGQESSRRLERFEGEINDAKEEVESLTKAHEDAQKQFEKVKQERVKQFDQFFEKLAANINETYKSLTRQSAGVEGRAIVYKENKEEPYNGGIFYSATPPTKKFVYDTDQLSGGEKTMAGLALMMTANIVSGFPFMFFDESDAFLDQGNTRQLLEVIKLLTEKNRMQIIVVTHKNMIYGSAQSLVGATFVPKKSTSECFSLDLRK